MHTATLHDDVVDESDLRHRQAAARRRVDDVLVSDFLFGQAFRMMVEVGSLPCIYVLSSAASPRHHQALRQGHRNDRGRLPHRGPAPRPRRTARRSCEVGPTLAGNFGNRRSPRRTGPIWVSASDSSTTRSITAARRPSWARSAAGDELRESRSPLRGAASGIGLNANSRRSSEARSSTPDEEARRARRAPSSNAPTMTPWRTTRSSCSPRRLGTARATIRHRQQACAGCTHLEWSRSGDNLKTIPVVAPTPAFAAKSRRMNDLPGLDPGGRSQ